MWACHRECSTTRREHELANRLRFYWFQHSPLVPAFFGYALLKDWDTMKPDQRDFGHSEAPESKARRHDYTVE